MDSATDNTHPTTGLMVWMLLDVMIYADEYGWNLWIHKLTLSKALSDIKVFSSYVFSSQTILLYWKAMIIINNQVLRKKNCG